MASQHASERLVKIKRRGCWGYHRSLSFFNPFPRQVSVFCRFPSKAIHTSTHTCTSIDSLNFFQRYVDIQCIYIYILIVESRKKPLFKYFCSDPMRNYSCESIFCEAQCCRFGRQHFMIIIQRFSETRYSEPGTGWRLDIFQTRFVG